MRGRAQDGAVAQCCDIANFCDGDCRRPHNNNADEFGDEWVHPESQANFLSKVTFSWLSGLLKRGATTPLRAEHLWRLQPGDDTGHVSAALALRLAQDKHAARDLSLWRAIRRAFGFNMYVAGMCKLFGDILGFVGPICLNELIKYVEDPSSAWFAPRYYGYILSGVLFASSALQTLFLHQHHHLVIREAIRARSALTMLVYNKSLRLSSQSKSQLGAGRILNMATIDTNRVLDLFYYVHYSWAAPLQLVGGLLLLMRFLGVASLAGVALMVVLLPLSALFSSQAAQVSKKLLSCTDARLKFLSELFQSIRVVKFYAWESELLAQVERIRTQELGFLKQMLVWNALSQVALQAGPILVSLASFAVYSWVEHEPLTPDKAFTAITLFSIFRLPLMMLPRIFSLIFQANVSVKRLEAFLATPEHDPPARQNVLNANASQRAPGSSSSSSSFIGIRNATFKWSHSDTDGEDATAEIKSTQPAQLANVSITIPKGQLTIIVGAVGSGKSTLLSALLGELYPETG
ncbi:Atp-binding protein, partial [Globisporangium polare]